MPQTNRWRRYEVWDERPLCEDQLAAEDPDNGFCATGSPHDPLPSLAIVLPAMLVPALVGMRVYIGISELAFRRIVLLMLTASGVALLVAALPVLLSR